MFCLCISQNISQYPCGFRTTLWKKIMLKLSHLTPSCFNFRKKKRLYFNFTFPKYLLKKFIIFAAVFIEIENKNEICPLAPCFEISWMRISTSVVVYYCFKGVLCSESSVYEYYLFSFPTNFKLGKVNTVVVVFSTLSQN